MKFFKNMSKKSIALLMMAVLVVLGSAGVLMGIQLTQRSSQASTDQGFDKWSTTQRWDPRNYEIPNDHLTKITPGTFNDTWEILPKELVAYTGFEDDDRQGLRPFGSSANVIGTGGSITVVDNVCYTGNKSLKVQSVGARTYAEMQTPHYNGNQGPPLRPKVGEWYGFEVMVEVEDLSGGNAVMRIAQNTVIGTTTSTVVAPLHGGSQEIQFSGRMPGWHKLIGFTPITDKNAYGLSIRLELPAGRIGTIYFDEFKLFRIALPPLKTVLLTPSYKGLIYGDGGIGDINLEAFIDDSGGMYDLSKMRFTSTITDTKYNPIMSTGTDNVTHRMDVSFSSGKLPNPKASENFAVYYIYSVLTDKQTGEKIQESWETIRKACADWRPDAYYDEENSRLMKKMPGQQSHEPWFLKNLRVDSTDMSNNFDSIYDKGITQFINGVTWSSSYWRSNSASMRNSVNYLKSKEIPFMNNSGYLTHSSTERPYENWGSFGSTSDDALNMIGHNIGKAQQAYVRGVYEALARDVKDDPYYIGYAFSGEADITRFKEEVRWANEVFSAYDINRPIFHDMNFSNGPHDYGVWVGQADIMKAWLHVFTGDNTYQERMPRITQDMRVRKQMFPNRPIVWTLGAWFRDYDTPTYQDIRCMAWQALCEGALGIDWYAVLENFKNNGGPHKTTEQWLDEMYDFFAEMTQWEPVIMSRDPAPHFTVVGGQPDWLNISTRRHNGKSYIFAVNNTYQTQSATINIGDITKTLTFDPVEVKITDDIPQNNFDSPLAKFHSIGFASDTYSLLVTYDKDGNKILHVPTGVNIIQYGAKISNNAKLFINGNEVTTNGTLTLDGPGTLTVKVVSQDGQHSVEHTYKYVASKIPPIIVPSGCAVCGKNPCECQTDNSCQVCGELPCICNNDPPPGGDCCVECGENPCVCDGDSDPLPDDDNKAVITAVCVGAAVVVTGIIASSVLYFLKAGRKRRDGLTS